MYLSVPSYALYGDPASQEWENGFSFEWIPSRSARYQWEIQAHRHEGMLQVLYLTKGDGQVQIEQGWHSLKAPCVVLLPAGTVHGFRFTPQVDGPVLTLAQGPLEHFLSVLAPAANQLLRSPRIVVLDDCPAAHVEGLMPLFLELEREARILAPASRAFALSIAIALCIQLQRVAGIALTMEAAINTASMRKSSRVQKFRHLVHAHFREHWSLQAYADLLGLSAGQLTRLCKEVTGQTGSELIAARLLAEAQRELAYGSNSIKQIAASLGFQDEAYFSRFFRERCGQTPREFRCNAVQKLLRDALNEPDST
jgi:AraC family transcriptional regulator, transcriptional activator of pobA